MVRVLRSQFVGENEDDLERFLRDFDPHISLAYAESFADETATQCADIKKSIEISVESLSLSSAFQFVVLMDTREPESEVTQQVKFWKACPIRMAI